MRPRALAAGEVNITITMGYISVSDPYTRGICILYDNDVTANFKGYGMVGVRVTVSVRISIRLNSLIFVSKVKRLEKYLFLKKRNIAKMKPFLNEDQIIMLAHAIILSSFD